MSRSTDVRVGTYLVCTMSTRLEEVTTRECSKDAFHQVSGHDRFCSECGAPVEHRKTLAPMNFSMHDVLSQTVILPSNDFDELVDLVSTTDVYDPAVSEEVLTFNDGTTYVDGDEDGIEDLPASFAVPTAEELETIARIMHYTNIEVKYGVIVSVSY